MRNPLGWSHRRGDIIEFEEKPIYRSHINAGVYVVEPDCLHLAKNEACDMPILFDRIRQEKTNCGIPNSRSLADVGRPSDLCTCQRMLKIVKTVKSGLKI